MVDMSFRWMFLVRSYLSQEQVSVAKLLNNELLYELVKLIECVM